MASDKYSTEVRDLHNEMVMKLGDEIAPCEGMKTEWKSLLLLFSNGAPLTRVLLSEVHNVDDLIRELMNAQLISFENYEPFAKKLNKVNKRMASLVRDYSQKIQDQIKIERGNKGSLQVQHSTSPLTAEQKRQIHGEMVTKLSEELSEDTKTKWAIFQNYLRNYLGFGDAKLAEITDIFKACRAMEAKGKIDVCKGEYDMLRAVVKNVDKKLVDIITEHLQKMGIETSPRAEWRFTRSISARSTESCDSD